MVGFRQKIAAANQTSICNATNVGRLTMGALLTLPQCYEVPMFQRRYCWTSVQWDTLLADAFARRKSLGVHSLGRLTCTNNTAGRSCILDGQQRFTTVLILLAALRDALARTDSERAIEVEAINDVLFPDSKAFTAWTRSNAQLSEGTALPFAKLVPSFCDRKAFYTAILPRGLCGPPPDEKSLPLAARPLQARRFFDDQLSSLSQPELDKLRRAVWNGFTMLYFPIDVDRGARDGTDDLMVVYERLALRDATWTKPRRSAEYVSMGGVDMIRNLLLGSFTEIDEASEFYAAYWLPLERAVEAASQASQRAFDTVFEDLFKALLVSKGSDALTAGFVGGGIYASFEKWFQSELASRSAEDAVIRTSQLLLEHAGDYPHHQD